MIILLHLILIAFGLVLLAKGADIIVKTSIYIAQKTGLPKFIIGVTVVAFGTSLPELIVSLISSSQGRNDLIIGNILGSNINNILFVIGAAAIISPIRIKKLVATRDIPFSIASVFIFVLLVYDSLVGVQTTNVLTFSDGLILLILFSIFIYYVAFSHKEHYDEIEEELTHKRFINHLVYGLLGFVGLVLGGTLIVESAIQIAESLGISERVIGLTVISIGTSFPELATIIVAVKKKEAEIGVGNVIGSNIFNLLFILGISSIINPIANITGISLDIFMLILSTFLLIATLFLGLKNKVDKAEGIFFLVIYAVYMFALFAAPQIATAFG